MIKHFSKTKKGFTPTPTLTWWRGVFSILFFRKLSYAKQLFSSHSSNRSQKTMPKLVSGFTLIEMMIATALFAIVMTIGIASLLSTNIAHKKNQTQRAIIDNLNFVMEDMSRNLRLGSNYRCADNDIPVSSEDSLNGPDCKAVSFERGLNPIIGDPNDQIVYDIVYDNSNDRYTMLKSQTGGQTFNDILPKEVNLDPALSGFTITGADLDNTDGQQSLVVIRVVGTVSYRDIETPFSLQTSVSQRAIEI